MTVSEKHTRGILRQRDTHARRSQTERDTHMAFSDEQEAITLSEAICLKLSLPSRRTFGIGGPARDNQIGGIDWSAGETSRTNKSTDTALDLNRSNKSTDTASTEPTRVQTRPPQNQQEYRHDLHRTSIPCL
ncbi:hypothetical protein Btru_033976 [Bulinus truncatus]|nr:hypothetical protein Btru_033976 [Bulinus truncatus]